LAGAWLCSLRLTISAYGAPDAAQYHGTKEKNSRSSAGKNVGLRGDKSANNGDNP
jgi:hypothetical protein